MKRTFNWDGEKIKENVTETDKKHTPMDILNALDNVRNQITQMKGNIDQAKQQIKQTELQLKSAEEFEKDLKEFEAKCVEIQKEKIKFIINKIHDECFEKAKKSAAETIAKSPDAYTEDGKKNLPYLDYQRNLATHANMAEKISQRMIRVYLFEEPIFDNPFKD